MKIIIAAGIALVSMTALASAQGLDPRYPYCVRGKIGTFGSFDCTYSTVQQCRASASPDGYCQRNPAYRANAGYGHRYR